MHYSYWILCQLSVLGLATSLRLPLLPPALDLNLLSLNNNINSSLTKQELNFATCPVCGALI